MNAAESASCVHYFLRCVYLQVERKNKTIKLFLTPSLPPSPPRLFKNGCFFRCFFDPFSKLFQNEINLKTNVLNTKNDYMLTCKNYDLS